MIVKSLKDTVETFAIAVSPSGAKNATLTLTWENTEASVSISVR